MNIIKNTVIAKTVFCFAAVLFMAGCSTLNVSSDPAATPTFAQSIVWLNDYFTENNKPLRIAEDRIHVFKPDAQGDAFTDVFFVEHGNRNSAPANFPRSAEPDASLWPHTETRNVQVGYFNGIIALSSDGFEIERFKVASEDEATSVVQHLMAAGIKYNRAPRIRSYACLTGTTQACPSYADDRSNRNVDPATAPCNARRCDRPR